jgi:cytochrome c oxidase subunit I+III
MALKQQVVFDVSRTPLEALGTRSAIWWGQSLMMVIESTIFSMLIASYAYVRSNFAVWPPQGTPLPDAVIPTVELVVLLISCVPLHLSDKASKQGKRLTVVLGMLGNLFFAAIFLGLRWFELVHLPLKWTTNIYGSFIWIMIGLHTAHAIADFVQTNVVLAIVLVHRVGRKQIHGIEVDSLYWYWVVGMWIPVWFVIYAYPYIIKSH